MLGARNDWGMADDRDRPWQDIADRLREVRAVLGLDQDTFAKRAGVKPSAYRNWETGLYRISLDGARSVCRAHGITLDFIYEGNVDTLPMSVRNELIGKRRAS